MHGVVQWNPLSNSSSINSLDSNFSEILASLNCSNLVTWQDRRVPEQFLRSLPINSRSNQSLHSGYALATLLYEQKVKKTKETWTFWGSIMDFIVWIFLRCPENYKVETSAQIANSFGYFDVSTSSFDLESLSAAGFPIETLPEIVSENKVIGKLGRSLFGLPQGCNLVVPFGDTQCAFYSAIKLNSEKLILNLGTSCQLGKILLPCEVEKLSEVDAALQIFPYFGNKQLALFASMNGGNVFRAITEGLFGAFASKLALAASPSREPSELTSLYEVLVDSGVDAYQMGSGNLKFTGSFYPERTSTRMSCEYTGLSMNGLSPETCSLGQFSLAIHRSVLENVRDQFRELSNVDASHDVVAIGSIFKKNKLFKLLLKDVFNQSDCSICDADSSMGAALFAVDSRCSLVFVIE